MSEIQRIAKTFIAYLKRPDLYPELGRKMVKNIFKRGDATKGKEKTNLWALSVAISQEEAIKRLFGFELEDFQSMFKDEYVEAVERQNSCPIKMGGPGAMELIYYACEFTEAKSVVKRELHMDGHHLQL